MNTLIFGPFRNIRVKTTLFVLLLLLVTTLIAYGVTVQIMRGRIINEVVKRAESLSRSIASTAGYSSMSEDILGLDTLVYKVKGSNPDIEHIAIVNPEGEIMVHSDVNLAGEMFTPASGPVFKSNGDGSLIKEISAPAGEFFEVTYPIVFMEKNLGEVVLSINKSVLFNAQRDAHRKIAWVFALILLVGIAGSILMTSLLTRPIKELSAGVDELKKGRQRRSLRVFSRDELGRLTESFNEMTALITAQKDELSKYARDLEESYVATVKVLSAAIDARDHYTLGHSTRVARLSTELGKALGMPDKELEALEVACLFHDVGKIKIPDSILLKQGKLDAPEYDEMKRHPNYGAEILSKAPSLVRYLPVVKHHHEWYDGSGYPDGLSRDRIPLPAAVTALADVYDAMTSDRPYRKALSEEEALRTILELSGRQFHPRLVDIFLDLVRNHKDKDSPGSSQ